jgi:hypothetical protein
MRTYGHISVTIEANQILLNIIETYLHIAYDNLTRANGCGYYQKATDSLESDELLTSSNKRA